MYKGGNVTIMVADFPRSVRFYTEVLGMSLVVRYGDEWAEVQGPGLRFGLHPIGSGNNVTPSRSVSFGFEVADLNDSVKTLSARGVQFSPINESDDAIRAAAFNDPDGHSLYLYEMRTGPEAPQPTHREPER